MTRRSALALALVRSVIAAAAGAQVAPLPADSVVVIHAATVLDGRGGTLRDARVVVRNGRIERVTSAPVAGAARVIELGAATLLPGLIDAHVHPGWYADRNGKRNG